MRPTLDQSIVDQMFDNPSPTELEKALAGAGDGGINRNMRPSIDPQVLKNLFNTPLSGTELEQALASLVDDLRAV
jgi:hypothetical protein